MKIRKFLPYVILLFIVAYLFLPYNISFATENSPNVNAPVALLIDSRYW